jgi:Protein of unknown function (DUF1566)
MLKLTAAFVLAATASAGALPTWDKKIDGAKRFKVLSAFDGAAVLDRETGLVWEIAVSIGLNWRAAHKHCGIRNTGGRMGWRLPALDELLTIVDPARSPATPEGAPFTGLFAGGVWTANEDVDTPTAAVTVDFNAFLLSTRSKTLSRAVLCVRGGRGSATGGRAGD